MTIRRYELTDESYGWIEHLLPEERPACQGRPWKSHRQMLNGMFWVLCSGAPWRDLPERYGSWKTVYDRFRRWAQSGLFSRLLGTLLEQMEARGVIDWSLFCLDGATVRATRDAAGALKKGRLMNLKIMRWAARVVDTVQRCIFSAMPRVYP